MRGGFPRSTDRSISTGRVSELRILHHQAAAAGCDPDDGEGTALALAQRADCSRRSGARASTKRSCASLHHSSRGVMPGSSLGSARRSIFAPRPGEVDQLGKRIRQASRADIVNREHGVGGAELPAAVDDLLGATLHLGVAALDRIEVQVLGVGACILARRRAAAHADEHSRAAQVAPAAPRRHFALVGMRRVDVAMPPAIMIGL